MSISSLTPGQLGVTVAPESLGFTDTSELIAHPLLWIGHERAEIASHFGLGMNQADFNLFVLGEVGSGRSKLLRQLMQEVAAHKAVPPAFCYLHNFDAPEKPQALHLPPGQGRFLRQLMVQMSNALSIEILQRLDGQDYKVESKRLQKIYKIAETKAYAELNTFAEFRQISLFRENGHLVFILMGEKGHVLTENIAHSLPKKRRLQVEQAEQELRVEISRYLDKTRPLERAMEERLSALRRDVVKPWLDQQLQHILAGLTPHFRDESTLSSYLDRLMCDLLDNLALFFRNLFGSIEYRPEDDALQTDFFRIRDGSLLKAHGCLLILHVRDLLTDTLPWEKKRCFLRSGKLQIEEPGVSMSPMAAVSLEPDSVDVEVKIILIGATEQYYELQEMDPYFARRFKVKVDFAESFAANSTTYHASALIVAHACRRLGLPHFTASGVARLLEDSHREVDDQTRQSTIFSHTEAVVMESAVACQARAGHCFDAFDVEAALQARKLRHDYPDRRLQESITEGDRLIIPRAVTI